MLESESNFLRTRSQIIDERGSFSKLFGQSSTGEITFDSHLTQVNYVKNYSARTLRGLHYQVDEFSETKIVHCIKGSVWDVIVDLRKNSPTYREWIGHKLSASNMNFMTVPQGFAHGYITLEDDSELLYFSDKEFSIKHERGIIWDDPNIDIKWPVEPVIISHKDQNWPTLLDAPE